VLSTFPASPPLHIVDFGSGSGNSALVLAFLFPMHRFTLVDSLPVCIELINKRVQDANITNVDAFQSFVKDYPHLEKPFDLGLAIHLCGEATDECMNKCFDSNADFVLVPCCVGKIAMVIEKQMEAGVSCDDVSVVYPRSKWLKEGMGGRPGMETAMYLKCARVADFSEAVGTDNAQAAKRLIDIDRSQLAVEKGYEVVLGKMEPVEASRKHDVIVGRFVK